MGSNIYKQIYTCRVKLIFTYSPICGIEFIHTYNLCMRSDLQIDIYYERSNKCIHIFIHGVTFLYSFIFHILMGSNLYIHIYLYVGHIHNFFWICGQIFLDLWTIFSGFVDNFFGFVDKILWTCLRNLKISNICQRHYPMTALLCG